MINLSACAGHKPPKPKTRNRFWAKAHPTPRVRRYAALTDPDQVPCRAQPPPPAPLLPRHGGTAASSRGPDTMLSALPTSGAPARAARAQSWQGAHETALPRHHSGQPTSQDGRDRSQRPARRPGGCLAANPFGNLTVAHSRPRGAPDGEGIGSQPKSVMRTAAGCSGIARGEPAGTRAAPAARGVKSGRQMRRARGAHT